MLIYTLSSIPYYNSISQEYRNILILNNEPIEPLKQITKRITLNKLSPFQSNNMECKNRNCVIGITKINNKNELMCIDDLPELFEFLINNNFTIDENMTKILQKSNVRMYGNLICFIKY